MSPSDHDHPSTLRPLQPTVSEYDTETGEDDAPPGRLGRHTVRGRLGRGGMGEVLRVEDPDLGREVAAKLLHGAVDLESQQEFVREGRLTGQLEHPNIIPVHELGQAEDGRAYFTMKCVHGLDLAGLLDSEALALVDVLRIVLKICDALSYAHSRGVIHRDLKPANVMVGEFGEVLVCDWGLAKIVGDDHGAHRARPIHDDPEVVAGAGDTRVGEILGTPAYMAPEQATGRVDQLDERTDVYALGAILYEALTGVAPHDGKLSDAMLADAAAGRVVTPCERAPDRPIPWELEAVVLRAMALQRARRYRSVAEMKADIEAFLAGRLLAAPRYTRRQRLGRWLRRHRLLVASSGLVLATLIGAVGWTHWQREQRFAARRAQARERVSDGADDWRRAIDVWRARTSASPGDAPAAEPPDERRRREALLDQLLEVTAQLDRLRVERPGDAALAALRRRAGERLGWIALAGGDHTLAARTFAALADHGHPAAEVEALVAGVAGDRERGARRRAARLDAILADVGAGLARPGRGAGLATLAEHVAEAAGMREPATAARIARALAPLIARARRGAARWTEAERDLLRFGCEVLGQLQLPGSVDPLAAVLETVGDRQLAAIAGRALCTTRRPEALGRLLALRPRLDPEVWRQLRPRLIRLPEAAVAEGDLDGLLARARLRRAAGRTQAAIDDLDRILTARPTQAEAWRERGLARLTLGQRRPALADLDRAVALRADAPALAARARVKAAINDRRGALADLARAIEQAPDEVALRVQRARLQVRAGDRAAAAADLEHALAITPRLAPALLLRGRLAAARGAWPAALRDLDQAVALDPWSVEALHERARGRQATDDLIGAYDDLTRAIELAPRDARGHHRRAALLRRMGNTGQAERDLRQCLRLDAQHTGALELLAQIHFARGEHAPAATLVGRAIATGRAGADAHYVRGLIRREAGDADGARADLDRCLALDPRHYVGHVERARTRMRTGDAVGAEADLAKAIALDAGQAQAWILRAQLRQQRGDHTGALKDWDRVVTTLPGEARPWVSRGDVRLATGDLAGALRDYDRAIALRPGFVAGHVQRGIALMHAGRFADADTAFGRAIALAPKLAATWMNRGAARVNLRRLEAALADFEQAVKLDASSWRAWLNLGMTRANLGRFPAARVALLKARALAPADAAKKIDAMLARIPQKGQ